MKKSKLVIFLIGLAAIGIAGSAYFAEDNARRADALQNFATNLLSAGLALVATDNDNDDDDFDGQHDPNSPPYKIEEY